MTSKPNAFAQRLPLAPVDIGAIPFCECKYKTYTEPMLRPIECDCGQTVRIHTMIGDTFVVLFFLKEFWEQLEPKVCQHLIYHGCFPEGTVDKTPNTLPWVINQVIG